MIDILKAKKEFKKYVEKYDINNPKIRLKIAHIERTSEIARRTAESLGLSEEDKALAELIGLLHDIGHLPYSHILEHAMHLLYEQVQEISEDERLESHNYFLSIMEKYCTNSGFEIHEELGKRFVDKQ